ncbi:MAG: hypothetical protein GSR86_05350 [Desulfurococcales archaeon]|nr:hypothetical protein [Desulfurococcales archaeon]
MASDRLVGLLMIMISVVVVASYIVLVFFPPPGTILGSPIDIFVLKVMGLIALLTIFGLIAWIGYTLLSSPRGGG